MGKISVNPKRNPTTYFRFWKRKIVNLHSIAQDPSFVAGKEEREPRNPPSCVRVTPTIHRYVYANEESCKLREIIRLFDLLMSKYLHTQEG
jgi:hypothetical protein